MADAPIPGATPRPRLPLRLAHRGDWRVAPENSLAAMTAALAIPACDGLEFDVRGSADGVPVLLHDATLARVQGLDAGVRDMTAEELGRHGVPALAEVLDVVGPEPFLDVELKGDAVPAVVGVLEAARGANLDRAVVSSFEADTLAWLGDRRPSWPRWLNAMSLSGLWIATARELGCAGISVAWSAIDSDGLGRAREAGLEVAAWTVRELATYRVLAARGLVAICAEAEALDG
ncbi:MAG TPA: glycerophosphodiester phosphodiesterase [Candidatus Limnocylindrales bacterium]